MKEVVSGHPPFQYSKFPITASTEATFMRLAHRLE